MSAKIEMAEAVNESESQFVGGSYSRMNPVGWTGCSSSVSDCQNNDLKLLFVDINYSEKLLFR